MQGRKRGTKSPANLSAPTCPSINHPLIHHPLTRHSSIDQSLPIYLLFIQPLTLPIHVSSPSVHPSLHSPSSIHPSIPPLSIIRPSTHYPPFHRPFTYCLSTHHPSIRLLLIHSLSMDPLSIYPLTYLHTIQPSIIHTAIQPISEPGSFDPARQLPTIHSHTYIYTSDFH